MLYVLKNIRKIKKVKDSRYVQCHTEIFSTNIHNRVSTCSDQKKMIKKIERKIKVERIRKIEKNQKLKWLEK